MVNPQLAAVFWETAAGRCPDPNPGISGGPQQADGGRRPFLEARQAPVRQGPVPKVHDG
jgi:hypothetical protein